MKERKEGRKRKKEIAGKKTHMHNIYTHIYKQLMQPASRSFPER